MGSIVWHSRYNTRKPEIIIRHITPRDSFQNNYQNILTRKRALIFGCIGFITSALVITMSFIPYQYTHINVSSQTKKEKGICDEAIQPNKINKGLPDDTFLYQNSNISSATLNDTISFQHNGSSAIEKNECNQWSIRNILFSEIWFGMVFGVSAVSTLVAGFRPTKATTISCLLFSMISLLTSLILLFYSVIWHSISMVISILHGLVSFICLVMTSKDMCHRPRAGNVA
jgi:cytochrome c oxidase subunit IV